MKSGFKASAVVRFIFAEAAACGLIGLRFGIAQAEPPIVASSIDALRSGRTQSHACLRFCFCLLCKGDYVRAAIFSSIFVEVELIMWDTIVKGSFHRRPGGHSG